MECALKTIYKKKLKSISAKIMDKVGKRKLKTLDKFCKRKFKFHIERNEYPVGFKLRT